MEKKFLRSFAVVLAAAAVSSSLATGISAASIFKQPGHPLTADKTDKDDTTVKVEVPAAKVEKDCPSYTEILVKYGILQTASSKGDPSDLGTIYVAGNRDGRYEINCVNPFTKPIVKPVKPIKPTLKPNYPGCIVPGNIICGGIYYDVKDAYVELSKYFNLNDYVITMAKGTEKAIASDAYMFSKDTSVAYYDNKTDKLVAVGVGQTEIYAYTKGGVPFMRFNVYVHAPTADTKKADTLVVTPADWNIKVNGTTKLTVKSESGKEYNDIEYKIVNLASKYATVSEEGVVTGKRVGAVMVRAYSKADPAVCGDAIIYVGTYCNMIYDGCWSVGPNGIIVNNWIYGGIYDLSSCYISGWIKSAEGTLIPVVKLEDATITDKNGNTTTGKVYTSGVISYMDLIIKSNETGKDIAEILKEYDIVASPLYGDKGAVAVAIGEYKLAMLDRLFANVFANTYFPVK